MAASRVSERVSAWAVVAVAATAVLLVPWAVSLGILLPSSHVAHHWDVAWTGFDFALAASLGAVAVAAFRRSPWVGRLATAAGTLLLADAWFDVLTSGAGKDRNLALAGLLVEVPLAIVCFRIAASSGE